MSFDVEGAVKKGALRRREPPKWTIHVDCEAGVAVAEHGLDTVECYLTTVHAGFQPQRYELHHPDGTVRDIEEDADCEHVEDACADIAHELAAKKKKRDDDGRCP